MDNLIPQHTRVHESTNPRPRIAHRTLPRYHDAMPATWPVWLAAVVIAYLIGSIPFGLLIGLAKGVDIRKQGSGNIGATNLGRVVGGRWGMVGFLLDVAKGLGPVLGAGLAFGWIGGEAVTAAAAGRWLAIAAAAMGGHVFPVYLKFKGGKGVATGFGVLLGMWPYLTLPAIAGLFTWLVFVGAMRYVGWASVIAALTLPGWFCVAMVSLAWPIGAVWPMLVVIGLMAGLVTLRHRGNLIRTWRGVEPRTGEG